MKRKIVGLTILILSIAVIFTACSKIDNSDNVEKKTEKTETATLSEAGKTAKITFQIEDNEKNNRVQIPVFSSDSQSEAINSLNKELDEIVAFYNESNNNKLAWPLIYTKIVEDDRYLQAVVEYESFPSIEGSSVASYVYDRKDDKALSVDDALVLADTTPAQLQKGVSKIRCTGGEKITKFDVQGFIIDSASNVEFFIKYEIDTGMDASNEIVTFVPATQTLLDKTADGIRIVD